MPEQSRRLTQHFCRQRVDELRDVDRPRARRIEHRIGEAHDLGVRPGREREIAANVAARAVSAVEIRGEGNRHHVRRREGRVECDRPVEAREHRAIIDLAGNDVAIEAPVRLGKKERELGVVRVSAQAVLESRVQPAHQRLLVGVLRRLEGTPPREVRHGGK